MQVKDDQKDEKKEKAATLKKKTAKQGFDDSERLTLKINVREATRYDAIRDKKTHQKSKKNVKKVPKNVYKNYEEDEDEDGVDKDVLRSLQELQINQNDASNGDTSLINALFPDEKRQIEQSTNIEITRREQDAGRQDALERTDKMLRQAGMAKMTTQEFMDQMTDALYEPAHLKRVALENQLEKKVGIKGQITARNEASVVRGVRKINEVTENRRVDKVTTKDATRVGRKNLSNNQTAELILEKSGQKVKLEEIKKQSLLPNKKDSDNKTKKTSYSKEMKELLRSALQKKDKVR